MKIAVFGAGGVGGYFGGRLAAAGHEVGFIARGAHLAAMREQGLAILSPLGDATIHPVLAEADPAALRRKLGHPDLVLFAVKLYDVESAATALKPLLGPESGVLALQNGVDAEGRIEAVLGAGRVAGGVAYISSTIEAPGVIRHFNRGAKLSFGEMDGRRSERLEAFAAAGKAAGFEAEAVTDIERVLWEKFIFLASFAGATALLRRPAGAILGDPDTKALFADALHEVDALARARGVPVTPGLVPKLLATAQAMGADFMASMARDLLAGNRIEIEGLSGAVVRLGREAKVATPVHRAFYAGLKLYAAGTPRS